MKKLLYLLMLLPLGLLVSCDNDDFAPFDMTVNMSGVTQANDTIYTVAGETVTFESLKINPVGGKETQVTNVIFRVNGDPLFTNPLQLAPPTYFSTQGMKPGIYSIGISGNLLQVDQSINVFAVTFPLVIESSQEDLPAGAPALGSSSIILHWNK